jgi:hypothetical protein
VLDASNECPAADAEPPRDYSNRESPPPFGHVAQGKSSSSPRASRPGPRSSAIGGLR